VLRFDGVDDALDLTNPITTTGADGYTVFAYIRPSDDGNKTIVAGDSGSFHYRINFNPDRQQLNTTDTLGLGTGTAVLPTGESAAFSSANVQANNVSGAFRLNGSADGTFSGDTFGAIDTVGAKSLATAPNREFFVGDIAEIRIYDTQLSLSEIEAVEAELLNTYQVPEPGSLALFGLGGLIVSRRRR